MAKVIKRVCTCEKCGNEAEMTISCTLEAVEEAAKVPEEKPAPRKEKATYVCKNCGNEADIWIDL